jgi:NADH-quinone oxidoreductase subunit G
VGVGQGTNLSDLGSGDVILVFASDLHEEAPLWWLRVKNAAKRGADLILANSRPTSLDAFASVTIHYGLGEAVAAALGLLQGFSRKQGLADYKGKAPITDAIKLLKSAENLVIFLGQDGLRFEDSQGAVEGLASLLVASDHAGKANNGLIPVWSKANTQGAWDLGFQANPSEFMDRLGKKGAAVILAADPAGDEPTLAPMLEALDFVVVSELFLSETAELADVVFPARSFIEREGSITSGERRVQRYYPAVQAYGESEPDWKILTRIGAALGIELASLSAAGVFLRLAETIPDYEGLSYQKLAEAQEQWPPVGDSDLYYGGTTYNNHQGLGVQLMPSTQRGEAFELRWREPAKMPRRGKIWMLPVKTLYDRSVNMNASQVLEPRMAKLHLRLNPVDAKRIGVEEGDKLRVILKGHSVEAPTLVEELVPKGQVLVYRHTGLPVVEPVIVELKPVS